MKAERRCEPILPGIENGLTVGDESKAPERVKAGDPPTYAEGCERILAPGEKWTGTFELVADKAGSDDMEVELSLGDAEAYDHASVMRLGFYNYFTNQASIAFKRNESFPESKTIKVPVITVSHKPSLVVDSERKTISGVVRDDRGIAHVMLFHGEDKVFFEGADNKSQLKSVPFSADVALEPGLNTITVLATDTDGATSTSSVVVFYEALAAKAESQENKQAVPNK